MSAEQPPLPGRPRDPQKDRDVLQATRELLVEVGYQGTTMVAIARRAGVGAPTIYRRWPRREALIEDAAFGHGQPAPLPKPTGDLRADLRAWTLAFLHQLADPVTRSAIPGLLMAYQSDEGLYERLVTRSERDVRALLTDLLRQSVSDPGQPAARADAVFDFLVASTVTRAMTVGLADRDAFCDRTADALCALTYSDWRPSNSRAASARTTPARPSTTSRRNAGGRSPARKSSAAAMPASLTSHDG
jgi:AcrR family transcriptional regulator